MESRMGDFSQTARSEMLTMQDAMQASKLTTGDIRKVSAKLFRSLADKSITNILSLSEALLEQRDWAMGVIAYDFAHRMKAQYDEATFAVFESWLIKYVRGWGDCDDFCVHAFGELIRQRPELTQKILPWTKREEFWMRRACAVALLVSIWRGKYHETNPLGMADILMHDPHDLVRKGYGWMLKELSKKEPELVYDYLMKHRDTMPRVAFRYALQKMDADRKRILMG